MYYRFSKFMRNIFKYGDVQNFILTTDKELNILIYWTPFLRHHIQELYTVNMVRFFGQPCSPSDSIILGWILNLILPIQIHFFNYSTYGVNINCPLTNIHIQTHGDLGCVYKVQIKDVKSLICRTHFVAWHSPIFDLFCAQEVF